MNINDFIIRHTSQPPSQPEELPEWKPQPCPFNNKNCGQIANARLLRKEEAFIYQRPDSLRSHLGRRHSTEPNFQTHMDRTFSSAQAALNARHKSNPDPDNFIHVNVSPESALRELQRKDASNPLRPVIPPLHENPAANLPVWVYIQWSMIYHFGYSIKDFTVSHHQPTPPPHSAHSQHDLDANSWVLYAQWSMICQNINNDFGLSPTSSQHPHPHPHPQPQRSATGNQLAGQKRGHEGTAGPSEPRRRRTM